MVELKHKVAAGPADFFSKPLNYLKTLGENVGKKFNTQKNKVVSNIKKLANTLGINRSTKKNLLKKGALAHDMPKKHDMPRAAKVGGSKRGKRRSNRRRRQFKRRTRK